MYTYVQCQAISAFAANMIIVAIVLRLFKMAPKNKNDIYGSDLNSAIGSRLVIMIMIILKQVRETKER